MLRLQALIGVVVSLAATVAMPADPSQRFVYPVKDRLVYDVTSRGERIVDFSWCGCGGGTFTPEEHLVVDVPAFQGDATERLQRAIDFAGGEASAAAGRVVVLQLRPGRYEVRGSLHLRKPGVVLRGAGSEEGGTTLVATGHERRAVIHVGQTVWKKPAAPVDPRRLKSFTPNGAVSVTVDNTAGLQVGDRVRIDHSGGAEWVRAVGMDRFPSRDLKGSWLDWKPGQVHLTWHRKIEKLDGDRVTLDAPLTYGLDPELSGVTLALDERFGADAGRPITNVGIEHLCVDSTFDAANPRDEEHAWDGVRMDHVEDAWVRDVAFRHLAGSAVAIWEHARRVTVSDCRSSSPVSELGGGRRQTFFTAGQQTLFLRCRADAGRHDFAVGHFAAGPNAFVDCEATNASGFSGAIGSWACGTLSDNVDIDGAALALTNRETAAQGTGWAAVNSVLWNCTAPLLECRMPPTGQNWAIGVWGEVVGDGHWRQLNEFASPGSLFRQQLEERVGAKAAERVLARAVTPSAGSKRIPLPAESASESAATRVDTKKPLRLVNGWLTFGDELAIGGRFDPAWWRGSVLPTKADDFGPCLTRFVPGREGTGYTDRVDDLVAQLQAKHDVVLGHHWGLWYDRRRDDHQMIRRMDGDVWPPFCEQPWARSGQGIAWDGLSKYDLTKFNPWYFGRLKAFADAADREGLVLIPQMYFQHNILEAGAHWADFPWRPANCLQETGFPEPPNYENRKRVFMAEAFYDVAHPLRRELHRAYIRHCLDVLGSNSNVLFLVGEEFTGPVHFVRFWIETIEEWQTERGKDVLVGLSCTKDVQDAVLNDAALSRVIDVIDLKYWWYTSAGEVYAPPGGANLAPRQQLREWKGKGKRTDAEVGRAILEYRLRYPGKAVMCTLPGANPWVVAASGGSFSALPGTTDERLLREMPRMLPAPDGGNGLGRFTLHREGGSGLRLGSANDTASAGESMREVVVDGKTGRVRAGQGSDPGGVSPESVKLYRVEEW
ncbi:MAG TPA: DUF6298 domain-containing protein [Caulifigura sp.]|nr:DUF6298 domain-containing protein [Caulifigura sp.]